jgi:GNAT superfamily N-acetyltransferase
MTWCIERLQDLQVTGLAPLVAESEQAGYRFVRRFVEEWDSGANRFDRPGEALFVARIGEQVVGVCGLNADPYVGEPRVGRVRRMYVRSDCRRCRIGRHLVLEVVRAAAGVFDRLRLRTVNPEAARFYERLGFRACSGEADCTHVLELGAQLS